LQGNQTLHQIGFYPNKKSYELHQPYFFTSMIVTSSAILFQKILASVPTPATPVLAIECSCPPPAPNINQPPMMETRTVGQRQCKIKEKQAEEM
jgi:hypothetical protein